MGCASSKHDELPAVALCHERCSFLDDAIHHRYALSEAHLAYTHSLKAVGLSLHRFFDQNLDNSMAVPPSPVLNLPTQRKGGYSPHKAALHHSNHSDSHIQFHSDSDDDSLTDSSLHHQSENSSPLHSYDHHHVNYPDQDAQNSYPGGGFMNMNFNYMKNNPTTSVTYQQRPMSPETLNMGESSSSYYSSYPYVNENPNSYSNSNNGYPPASYGGGFSGFFGSTKPPPPPVGPVAEANSEASSSKPPPPPPSPPSSSTWDFLYPFQSFENYYPPYTPIRDSKELREAEGIPDLEDEDFQHEVVKEVHGDQKFVDGGGKNYEKGVAMEQQGGKVANGSDLPYGSRPKVSIENDPVASGNELAKIFEVGKSPYKKNAAYQVSSKMLHVITPSSQPSTSTTTQSSSIEIDEDVGMSSSNLSSTLQKLYLWEKKLYEEVKVEEKMRVLHERKCGKLKHLDERGAEAHKIDATRTLVRSLSTKIRIAIQVVDKISVKINKLRDEELLPQLNEFIQGLTRMWKAMLECHRSQCQAMGQANRLDVASRKHFSDARLDATLQLEQTPDGPVPFSPGRIGAPPVFGLCNQWSQALDGISEKEVVDSMRDFATCVLQLWKQDKLDMHQRMMVNNRDMERKVKNLEREDQKMQKEIQALEKRIVQVSGDSNGLSIGGHVYQSDTSKTNNLQVSLQHIFEAMEKFTAKSLEAYEELLQRIEDDKLAQEKERVS
ncbi:Nitrate regulatory gene2 protein [Camellia lanceoleosa]|nr:Nitrate regulatory gene2 protein [Camellia lanceoleosa]